MTKSSDGRTQRVLFNTHFIRTIRVGTLIILPLVVVLCYSQDLLPFGWVHALGTNFASPVTADSDSATSVVSGSPHLELHPEDTPWSNILPSRTLAYHDCFRGLKCARLLLPLTPDPSVGPASEIAVAVIRRPAKVPITDDRYGGVVIINPGGPGASGVDKVLQDGERMQNIVDSGDMHGPGTKFFDLIGFVPRASHHTVPRLNCFSDTFSRLVWNLQGDAEGLFTSSNVAFDQKWARFLSRSTTCMEQVASQGPTSIGYYMGTRSVVDDIVGIAERHGEWREAEAQRVLARVPSMVDAPKRHRIREKTRWKQGQEPVLFWGTSYGTVLGATLAAIYPHRVSRIVLDAVVEPEPYHEGLTFRNLVDSDKVWSQFGFFCHKYGPQHCRFYRESPEAILADVDAIATKLISAPLVVPASTYRGPHTITWSDLKRLIAESLYDPIAKFPVLADLLQDLSQGEGSAFADYKAESRSVSVPDIQNGRYNLSEKCIADHLYSPTCHQPNEWFLETLLGIGCGDGSRFRNFTKTDFVPYSKLTRNYSRALGDVWAEWDLMCAGWNAPTKWRYNGSFASHTAQPILLVGNTLDPVCPLQDAHKVASGFPGSVVLAQDASGHGILAADSKCMDAHVREYFQSGRLPTAGNVCPVEHEPFEKRHTHHNLMQRLRF